MEQIYTNIQTKEVLNMDKVSELADNAMLKVKPDLWIEWDFKKNKDLYFDIWTMTKSMQKKVWWICTKCKRNIDVVINTRVNTNSKCGYCSGKIPTSENCLQHFFPDIAKEWHPTMNRELTPLDVLPHSSKKVWWLGKCGHEWESRISGRTKSVISKCPYCIGQRVCKDNSLASINPTLAKEWHPTKNGNLSPHDVTCGSNKKFWWMCNLGHEWKTNVNSRNRDELGCPYCTNQKTLIGYNNINYTNPEMSIALVNKVDGDIYTQGSNKKVEFKCPDCNKHLGCKSISDVLVYGLSCSNCSDGIPYPEKLMSNLLSDLNIDFKYNTSFDWSQGKIYDFYIPSINMIIETHGGQHFNGGFSTLNGNNLQEEQENDKYKEYLANANKIDNYIVIDCRKSEVEWIKDKILNSELNKLLSFNNIDWDSIDLKSSKSLLIEVCDEYNSTDCTVAFLSEKYRVSKTSIYRYLDRGFDLKLVSFKKDSDKFKSK